MLHGAAHITGGGLLDNIPRVLPEGCRASINAASWKVPAIFKLIGGQGNVPDDEMYQVFNMGIGMVLVVAARRADEALRLTKGIRIGEITDGPRDVVIQ
jgi:phosphoribosylformylglycinamidine cyclo-ligase